MQRKPYFANIRNILKVSFGLVTFLGYAFLLFHTSQFVDAKQQTFWWTAVIGYSVMLCLIMAVPGMRNKLFNVSAFKFILRFFLFYIPSIFVLKFLLGLWPGVTLGIFGLLKTVPTWLLFVHGFVFATIETTIWQGFLDDKIGHPWSELSAGIFHWGVWQGSAVLVVFSAGLLFMCFSLFNWYFRNSKNDIAPATALHTAYNHLKLLSFT